jgi:hypothetical protein
LAPRLLDSIPKLLHAGNRLPVHFLNHVAAPQARFLGRAGRLHIGHYHSSGLRGKAKLPRRLRRQ